MVKVIGVRFKKVGKIYYFSPGKLNIKKDDFVIVETVRGIEYGEAVTEIKEVDDSSIVTPLKDVLRIADDKDKVKYNENKEAEKRAFDICLQKIKDHNLVMKLIDVEYTFDNNKVIFYFTADGRVDFRELVKDLASVFRTRIELRQIGVRDEAKMIGGIGPCGRVMCCSSYLGDFEPVSIKMAKEQNLSLNPTKISGICGRLMCCLNFEEEAYEEIRRKLPAIGSIVDTPYGNGEVTLNSTVKETVRVKIKSQDGEDILKDVSINEVKLVSGKFEAAQINEKVEHEKADDADSGEINDLLKDN